MLAARGMSLEPVFGGELPVFGGEAAGDVVVFGFEDAAHSLAEGDGSRCGVLFCYGAQPLDPVSGPQPHHDRAASPVAAEQTPFILRQSKYFADRLRAEASSDPQAQSALAYRLAFAREPTEHEAFESPDFVGPGTISPHCVPRSLTPGEFVYVD